MHLFKPHAVTFTPKEKIPNRGIIKMKDAVKLAKTALGVKETEVTAKVIELVSKIRKISYVSPLFKDFIKELDNTSESKQRILTFLKNKNIEIKTSASMKIGLN